MRCSSSLVPSVVVTSAWVSPRVNSAEPWVRGSTPTSTRCRADLVERAAIRTRRSSSISSRKIRSFRFSKAILASTCCVFRVNSRSLLLQVGDHGVAFELAVLLRVQRVGQSGRMTRRFHLGGHFGVAHGGRVGALRLAGLFDQFADARIDLLAALVAELDRRQHFLFARSAPGFHHDDAGVGAGHDDVQGGLLLLLVARQDDHLAIHLGHANAADDVFKRNVGDRQSAARADNRQRGSDRIRIGRQHQAHHLRIVARSLPGTAAGSGGPPGGT
jgi:hypothetical protein